MPSKDRFQLLALSCILIASKYLGPEEEVPPISEFWEFGNRCYSYEEIHEMELITLSKYVSSLSVRHEKIWGFAVYYKDARGVTVWK
jgi:hypothetical protein